jgi:hypothetical protein
MCSGSSRCATGFCAEVAARSPSNKDHASQARLYTGALGAILSQCWSYAPVSGSLRAPTDGELAIWQWDSRRGDQDKFRLLALPRC